MRVPFDHVDSQDARHAQLLALLRMRRGLESHSANKSETAAIVAMTGRTIDRARSIRDLQELVAALDRRVPRVEHAGEIAIAHAAAELKSEASRRIEELERRTAAIASSEVA